MKDPVIEDKVTEIKISDKDQDVDNYLEFKDGKITVNAYSYEIDSYGGFTLSNEAVEKLYLTMRCEFDMY